MNDKINIVLAGVGGQGVITAAKILGEAAVKSKTNVFISEIHGISQRGGAIVCTVRMGNASSPLIPTGTADVILSTEPIEVLRNITYANKNTKVITDVNPVIPFTVTVGKEKYPNLDDVFREIELRAELFKIDALKIAKETGTAVTKNIVILGVLAGTNILPFKPEILLKAVLDNVPAEYKEINEKSFQVGMNAIKV